VDLKVVDQGMTEQQYISVDSEGEVWELKGAAGRSKGTTWKDLCFHLNGLCRGSVHGRISERQKTHFRPFHQ